MARRRKGRPIHGWIVIDKPAGLSSAQVVGRVRWLTDAAKAGHAGTLDPLATGVLPIALGEATKTVAWAMEGRKTYRFTLRWGESRDTDDAEGAVLQTSGVRPDSAAIGAALAAFRGTIVQRPPRYSAIKLDGRRSYELARAKIDAEPPLREVEVDALELIEMIDLDHCVLEMRCGKGAYVRSIARDLALALGTFGYVSQIRRLAVGGFVEDGAISLEKLAMLVHSAPPQEYLLPIETALDDIPALALSDSQANLLRHGRPVRIQAAGRRFVATEGIVEGETAYAIADGRPVALVRIEQGEIRPMRVLNL